MFLPKLVEVSLILKNLNKRDEGVKLPNAIFPEICLYMLLWQSELNERVELSLCFFTYRSGQKWI